MLSYLQGWDTGIVGMKKGGQRVLVVPPNLAYGESAMGDKVPPNSSLVFQIEVTRVTIYTFYFLIIFFSNSASFYLKFVTQTVLKPIVSHQYISARKLINKYFLINIPCGIHSTHLEQSFSSTPIQRTNDWLLGKNVTNATIVHEMWLWFNLILDLTTILCISLFKTAFICFHD